MYELNIVSLPGCPFSGFQDAVHIGPLFDEVSVLGLYLGVVSNYVVRDDVYSQIGYHFGKFMLYERVGVIRASGEQDDRFFFSAAFPDNVFGFSAYV